MKDDFYEKTRYYRYGFENLRVLSACMIPFPAGQNKEKGCDGKHGERPGSILLADGEAA